MASTIKVLVSRKKKRYKEDGFNLDLTYIFDNVIAMGYPAAKLEGVYRNHINDVFKFLETKHKDHYKIYNLCSERSYDSKRFHERVAVFPFDDHNPPKLELIQPFCRDVDEWLAEDPQNVAVVHCKAGKGRTGVMICCYILHRRWYETADEALRHYGEMRTHDTKGVTIPSQRRYVDYYDQLLKSDSLYSPQPLVLHEVHMEPVPSFNGGCVPVLTVLEAESQTLSTRAVEMTKVNGVLRMTLNSPLTLKGDVRMTFKNKPNVMMMKEKMFHFWFNTYFVKDDVRARPSPKMMTKMKSNNGLESPSMSKSTGMSFSRLGASLLQKPERACSYLAPNTNSHMLTPASRASSLNSVYSDNLSTNTSQPVSWLTLTLTKRELDRACKDTNHRIFAADFKVTLIFTRLADHQNNGICSLPNVGFTGLSHCSSDIVPSMLTNVQSAPHLSSSSVNHCPMKGATADGPGKALIGKPSSPRSLGLLGPICWRADKDHQTEREADELDGAVDAENGEPFRHSGSSHWSSEEADSSDLETHEQSPNPASADCQKDEDEEGGPHSSYESLPVGRYRLLSFSALTYGD